MYGPCSMDTGMSNLGTCNSAEILQKLYLILAMFKLLRHIEAPVVHSYTYIATFE